MSVKKIISNKLKHILAFYNQGEVLCVQENQKSTKVIVEGNRLKGHSFSLFDKDKKDFNEIINTH
jgi:hypothetical protein